MTGGPRVHIMPILHDNYTYIVGDDPFYAVIDPGEAQSVIDWLGPDRQLSEIFITHHHNDHTGGIAALRARYPDALLIGPAAEEYRIPGMDHLLREGDHYTMRASDVQMTVIETPGHTAGHICFHAAQQKWLFSGDALFSLGCGRLFEGTAAQMWNSLQKIAALPDETLVYCGHEYTLANGRFALTVEQDNIDLMDRMAAANALRGAKRPTLPVRLGLEKKTNPFLRAGSAERFAALRLAKDNF